MANPDHLEMLRQGVDAWNVWRKQQPVEPDLSEADHREMDFGGADLTDANLGEARFREAYFNWEGLREVDLADADLSWADIPGANLIVARLSQAILSQANLTGADLGGADLSGAYLGGANLTAARLNGAYLVGADLSRAYLTGADLGGADLSRAYLTAAKLPGARLNGANLTGADLGGADLSGAYLGGANLTGADLTGADLHGAYLRGANLTGADLTGADLTGAHLIRANLTGARLTGCRIYGVSAWGLTLTDETRQRNLIITTGDEPEITVDDIEVAQFVYLLLNNAKIRNVIDTITSKAVLILGRFTVERKAVLDALRDELRKHDYLPILFDFEGPESRDITETVSLLARMARFIIADLTDPSSIPKELEAIVSSLAVPVQPLLEGLARPYAMFKDYWKYDWVLPPHRYEGLNPLLSTLADKVIAPAEAKVKALEERRRAIEAELTTPRTSL